MTIPADPSQNKIDEFKKSVQQGDAFEVERELPEGDLDTVSGGVCQCKCAADNGGNPTCGGGGGGGGAFEEPLDQV
jgi:hypothetical protein